MKISACYIVKNEAAVLARSIESLADGADELLVVDTGSTDDTVDMAKRYGARVLQHDWQDDFAEARNFAIEQAEGDWIVFLDADEYFTEGSCRRLRQIIEQNQQEHALLIKRLDIDVDRNNEVLAALFVLRAFPRLPSLRFDGRIHEELRENGEDVQRAVYVPEQDVKLMHTGYSASVNRAKAERNLKLLLAELRETKTPGRIYGYLADAWLGIDDKEKAMQYARLDVAQGRRAVTYASRSYRILLPLLAENGNTFQERRRTAEQAAADFPELPEFHAEYAECLAYAFDYEGAVQEGERAIALQYAPEGVEQTAFTAEQALVLRERIQLWKRILERMSSIRLTACAIVKNEAGELHRWIQNVRSYADDIFLVDTGSEDGTRELAEQEGIRVIDFAWIDDFAAARNFMIEQATGDWILSPDADEYFAAPQNIRAFMAETDILQPDADAVMVISPNIDADCSNQEINRYPVVRIFRRCKELRYVGNVHESLWKPQGELRVFMEKYRVLLMHTGYSTKRILQKTKRDLALLLEDIRKNGEGPQHYGYLAACYFGLGEYEKSLHYDLLAMDASVQGVGVISDLYQQALFNMQHLKRPLEEQLSMACRGRDRFPLLPDFYAYEGDILCACGRLGEGKIQLERARELFEHPQDQSGEATMAHNIMSKVYCRLGRFYSMENKKDEAREEFRRALQLGHYNEEVLTAYADLMEDEPAEVFAAGLAEFYDENRQNTEYLMHWAEQAGFVKLYQHYAGIMQQKFGQTDELLEFYALTAAGKYQELEEKVVQRAVGHLQELFTSLLYLVNEESNELQTLWKRSARLLPDAVQHVLQRYAGGGKELLPGDYDGFQSMLPAVLLYNTPEQVQQYVRLALDFSWEQVWQTAQRLYAQEQWLAAMSLYQEIPADAAVVTAGFWHDVGVCLYRLRQPEAALEALKRAQGMGSDARDTAAYLAWIGEAERC